MRLEKDFHCFITQKEGNFLNMSLATKFAIQFICFNS